MPSRGPIDGLVEVEYYIRCREIVPCLQHWAEWWKTYKYKLYSPTRFVLQKACTNLEMKYTLRHSVVTGLQTASLLFRAHRAILSLFTKCRTNWK